MTIAKQEIPEAKAPVPVIVAKPTEVAPVPVDKPQETSPKIEPKEEVAIKKDAPAPVVPAPLTLSMNIIGQRKEADGRYTEVVVREASVLRSYDNLQIHLETNRHAYIYVLLYDSQGKAGQIFPDPKIDHPGFIEGGKKLVVPSADLWFWLDESTGTETIYVLASENPMSDIRGLMAKMEAADEGGKRRFSQEIKQKIVQRGVAVVAKGQSATYTLSDGKKIQKVTEVVTGTGTAVRALTFQHR